MVKLVEALLAYGSIHGGLRDEWRPVFYRLSSRIAINCTDLVWNQPYDRLFIYHASFCYVVIAAGARIKSA